MFNKMLLDNFLMELVMIFFGYFSVAGVLLEFDKLLLGFISVLNLD